MMRRILEKGLDQVEAFVVGNVSCWFLASVLPVGVLRCVSEQFGRIMEVIHEIYRS